MCGEAAEPGEYGVIEVTDDGGGMSADTVGRIFDPFFTTKFTGRGLGLAAVKAILREHHGALRVESEPGRGTTMSLFFPIEPRTADLTARDAPAAETVPERVSAVLVADDDEAIRVFAKIMNDDSVGVMKHRGGAGFAVKTLAGLFVFDHVRAQHFDGDGIADVQPARAINFAHPAAANAQIKLITPAQHASNLCANRLHLSDRAALAFRRRRNSSF